MPKISFRAASPNKSVTKSYEYDDQGRQIKVTYTDGTFTETGYDAAGNRISETDALGLTTNYEYDQSGRLSAVILPPVDHPTVPGSVRSRWEYSYDASGNHIGIRDIIGRMVRWGMSPHRSLRLGVLLPLWLRLRLSLRSSSTPNFPNPNLHNCWYGKSKLVRFVLTRQ